MPLVTATFSTGGNVVIDDTVEVAAISALTQAVNANTLMIEKLFGPAGSQTPGSLTACASGTVGELWFIHHQIVSLNENINNLNTALGDISKEVSTGNRGLANINTNLTKQLTTQQVALVDQMKNNQFQQTATNAALADAGKGPVTVPPTAWVEKVKTTVTEVGDIKAQIAVSGWVEGYLTETITEANIELTKWVAETEIGKGVIKLWGDLKLKVKTIFAPKIAENISNRAQAAVVAAKAGLPVTPTVTEE